jgi:hypothetical protein
MPFLDEVLDSVLYPEFLILVFTRFTSAKFLFVS